jgi:4-amino-4-deoxy-L-arabinose transferase-like glycosyltransferase
MKFQGSNWWLLALIVGVYVAGMFVDLMEADAAQYASMSLEMLRTGNYLEIYHRGTDYIDKPPLIFWSTALSFKLFGVSNFTYKLPSVLFTLLGLFSTFQFARMYYGQLAGYVSTLALASCHAWFQINQDVRTDTILAACTIFAVWQLACFDRSKKTLHVVWASLGMAGAMLTKGPIGLMVPVLAFSVDVILKRKWGSFFRWQWLLAGIIILICLSPMIIGLWRQFDAAGGKQTYNGFVGSGLRFYFWTQSFGRLTGESTWRNDTGFFFFAHTFLWAFLPWSILAIWGYLRKFWQVLRSGLKIPESAEAYTIGGSVLPALAFSLSQYKLPHYIFVFFPLVAVVAGAIISDIVAGREKGFRTIRATQNVIAILLLMVAALLSTLLFPDTSGLVIAVVVTGAIAVIVSIKRSKTRLRQLILPSLLAITTLNLVFNTHFYPELLKYESGDVAGKIARSLNYPLIGYHWIPYGIDFYYRDNVPIVKTPGELAKSFAGKEILIYADEAGFQELKDANVTILKDIVIEHYHVSTLSLKFLLPHKRTDALVKKHLVIVRP